MPEEPISTGGDGTSNDAIKETTGGTPPNNPNPTAPQEGVLDWRSHITDEGIRSNESIKNIQAKDEKEALNVLSKMYINAQSQIGKEKVLRPQDDWTDEQKLSWSREVLGVPETLEGYPFDQEKYGKYTDEESLTSLRQMASDIAMTPQQFEKFTQSYFTQVERMEAEDSKAQQLANQQADENLKQAWGRDYESNMSKIGFLVEKSKYSEEIKGALESNPALLKDPAVAKLLAELAGPFIENSTNTGDNNGKEKSLTLTHSSQVEAKIRQLMSDPIYTYVVANRGRDNAIINLKSEGKDHVQAIAKYDSLIKEISELHKQQTLLRAKEQGRA